MSARILHPQWRDYNDPIRYPFADRATLTNADGLAIPETTFIDAVFYAAGMTAGLYISSITVAAESVTIVLGDNGTRTRCSGTFDLLSLPSSIRFLDARGRAAGLIVSEPERLSVFQAWPLGTHEFSANQTPFAVTCCAPTPTSGITSVTLEDGSTATDVVWLMGGDGVVLTPRTVTEKIGPHGEEVEVTVIRVDVVGDPLFRRRLCGDKFEQPNFLRELVVTDGTRPAVTCSPDAAGNIKIMAGSQLAGDTVLRIRTDSTGIVFETVGKTT